MRLPLTSVINSVGSGSIVSTSRMIAAAGVVVVVIAGGLCGVQKRHQRGRRQGSVNVPQGLKGPVDRIRPATVWVSSCCVFVTLGDQGLVVIKAKVMDVLKSRHIRERWS